VVDYFLPTIIVRIIKKLHGVVESNKNVHFKSQRFEETISRDDY